MHVQFDSFPAPQQYTWYMKVVSTKIIVNRYFSLHKYGLEQHATAIPNLINFIHYTQQDPYRQTHNVRALGGWTHRYLTWGDSSKDFFKTLFYFVDHPSLFFQPSWASIFFFLGGGLLSNSTWACKFWVPPCFRLTLPYSSPTVE